MPPIQHQVPPQIERARLSDYLVDIFAELPSRKRVKKAIKAGQILVDGEVGTTGRWINGGESIVFEPPATVLSTKLPDLSLKIHFEDDDLAVVEKPPGILTNGNRWMTLANALPTNLRASMAVDALVGPLPAHRLDYPTSGLVLVGKTATSLDKLNQLFKQRNIQKTYHAVVIGDLPELGVIDQPIDGREAISHYQRLSCIPSRRFGQLNLVRLRPKTGRRHQLRIHLSGLGCPILGDQEYGREGLVLLGKGLYLHASKLAFVHPISRQQLEIESELPKKFRKLFPGLDRN